MKRIIKWSKGPGFTLVELLIVIGIVGVLTSVGLVSFLRNRQISDLDRSASELASNIRKIQGYTRSGRSEGGKVPRAYGLMVDLDNIDLRTNQYTLYADFGTADDDFYYDLGALPPDVMIEQFTLAANTYITGVEITGARGDYDRIDFGFFVPSSDMRAMGTALGSVPPSIDIYNEAVEVKITVTHLQANKNKIVKFTGGLLGGATVEEDI